MSDEKLLRLYKQADADFHKARNELYKPLDDVVTYSACTFSRSALYHFLSCLYVHGTNDTDPMIEKGRKTIDELIKYGKDHYPEIKEMDFNPVRCKNKNVKDVLNDDEIYFCNDPEQVMICTSLAEQIKELISDRVFDGNPPKTEQF
jgi:hypothetical protein